MRICTLDKITFMDWLDGKFSPSSIPLTKLRMKRPLDDEIALVFGDESDGTESPIIVVPKESLLEFYAFVGTYVEQYKPFSAYFRVLPYETLLELTSIKRTSEPNRFPLEKIIGVAITEVYAQSRGRLKAIDKISVSAAEATLSTTLAEAIQQGYSSDQLPEITDRWEAVRRLERADELYLKSEKILEVWQIISDATSSFASKNSNKNQRAIVNALKKSYDLKENIVDCLASLARELPNLDERLYRMTRSREERVKVSNEILPLIWHSDLDILLKEFLSGAILSMIGNGSLLQLPALDMLLKQSPATALWFGVFSSLQRNNDVMTAGNCLGRRLVRDMHKISNVFSRIEYDISVEELMVMRGEGTKGASYRTAQPTSVKVGLIGNISGRFKINSNITIKSHDPEINRNTQLDKKKIEELRYLLERANRISNSLLDKKKW